jgi:hypothetical protein
MPENGMFRCPNGHLGRIDEDQRAGEVSIICDSCDFHGYVQDGELLNGCSAGTGTEQSGSDSDGN